MKRIYADNAATAFPKPPGVAEAMCSYINEIGSNVSRGAYDSAIKASSVVYETRQELCKLFNSEEAMNVVLTANVTESLNTVIKGLLKRGDHVITTSMEHNAVVRPLHFMIENGIEHTMVQCEQDGSLKPEFVKQAIKGNTKLVVMTHASNVCGTILPIEEVGAICKDSNIEFCVDTAQTAGIIDIDVKRMNISALAFTGHKGLMGPQGTGGILLSRNMAERVRPFKEGGTGSFSDSEAQPEAMPDKFESGTLNIPGIFGLKAALSFLNETGINNIYSKEKELSKRFLNKLLNMDKIILSGLKTYEKRMSVFSLNFGEIDNSEAAFLLDREFGIATRVGLHCAPWAHKTLGTYPQGSVRLSFGFFNTFEEVDYIAGAIFKISQGRY